MINFFLALRVVGFLTCNLISNLKLANVHRKNVVCSSSTSSEDYEVDEGVGGAREAPESGSVAEEPQMDESEPSMWLGTEDGFIHVYASSDSIRVKKNKIKMHHGSSVYCIL